MEVAMVLRENPVSLAPLAGILDLPLRLTFRRYGCGLTWIGAIDAEAVARNNDGRLINLLGGEEHTHPAESPFIIQLIGNNAGAMAKAAALLEERAEIFNLNFSGPIGLATRRGWGARLLEKRDEMARLVESVIANTERPVTAKIRITPDGKVMSVLELAKRLRDGGIAALFIHCRTPQQGYVGPADWGIVRQLAHSLDIPVVGNGGIRNARHAYRLLKSSGCAAVMVGRAAMRDPLLFRQYGEFLRTGRFPRRSHFSHIMAFAREYAAQAQLLSGEPSPVARSRMILRFFVGRWRTEEFALRKSGILRQLLPKPSSKGTR